MNKYIDAEKLIAEINNRLMLVNLEELGNFGCHRVWAYNDVKDLIASLLQEQPEVDLEKEIKSYFNGWEYDPYSYEITTVEGNAPTLATLRAIARHFYELGKNARKE